MAIINYVRRVYSGQTIGMLNVKLNYGEFYQCMLCREMWWRRETHTHTHTPRPTITPFHAHLWLCNAFEEGELDFIGPTHPTLLLSIVMDANHCYMDLKMRVMQYNYVLGPDLPLGVVNQFICTLWCLITMSRYKFRSTHDHKTCFKSNGHW